MNKDIIMQVDVNLYTKQFFDTFTYGPLTYRDENGIEQKSGHQTFRNKWEAWIDIFKTLNKIMGFQSVLDIGCGCGYSIKTLRELGFEAIGVDFSPNAVSMGWIDDIILSDATSLPFKPNQFDMVMSSSVMEHIYNEDIDTVLNEMFKVSKKWIFLNIDGYDEHDDRFCIIKNENSPINKHTILGHVTIQDYDWWIKRIGNRGIFRGDMVSIFLEELPNHFNSKSYKFIYEKPDRTENKTTKKRPARKVLDK